MSCVSGRKSPAVDLQSLGFTSSQAKLKRERRLGDEEPAHEVIEQNESG